MGWHSIHVYHYDEDKDRLVVEAVGPALRSVAADGYFVRHWRRGPHLRLNIRAEDKEYRRAVRPVVVDVVGRYLDRRPSTAVLDEQALRPLHEALARAERDDGPRSPWLPDNSIHDAEYDARLHVLGDPAAAELLADFYVATNDIAVAMAERVLHGEARLTACFDLLIATAYAFSGGGLMRGFVSFRSHAEAFLTMSPDGARYREEWQRRYAVHADRLRTRVENVAATLDGTGAVPLVREWVAALRPVHRRAWDLVASGALLADEPPPPPITAGMSPFHEALLRGPTYTAAIRGSVWFRAYRVMLNCLYLQLTRHGVRPVDRQQLCHLAANTVEDWLGVTALDLVAGRAVQAGRTVQ
jgi:lantibiotic biosynthesis dehydratase-like protein